MGTKPKKNHFMIKNSHNFRSTRKTKSNGAFFSAFSVSLQTTTKKKSIQQNHIHTQKKNTPDQSSTSKTQRKRHPSELSKKKGIQKILARANINQQRKILSFLLDLLF